MRNMMDIYHIYMENLEYWMEHVRRNPDQPIGELKKLARNTTFGAFIEVAKERLIKDGKRKI